MPVKIPEWFESIPAKPMAVGEVGPAVIIDTDDPYITVAAVVPAEGVYTLDLSVDANFNGIIDPMEVGPMNWIREGNILRATIGDSRSKPPTAKRYVRVRRVK